MEMYVHLSLGLLINDQTFGDFPSSPVLKAPPFYCWGLRFHAYLLVQQEKKNQTFVAYLHPQDRLDSKMCLM